MALRFQHCFGLGDAAEPMFVQALVPELAVETLPVSTLHRFAGLDEVPPYASLADPGVRGFTRRLDDLPLSEPAFFRVESSFLRIVTGGLS